MRKQCPQLVFFKLDTIDTWIKSFIHSIPLPPSPPIEQKPPFLLSRKEVQDINLTLFLGIW